MLTTRLGWFGAVAYALPILEVWLLTRLSEDGADVFLVALQVVWVMAFLFVLDRTIRGSRAYRDARDAAEAEAAAEAEREALAVANAAAAARSRAEAAAARRVPRPLSSRGGRPSLLAQDRRRSHR
ncbi:hypothetical protein DSM112329_04098 [Paraconexibacter sp. AEG42_29]|uniref:Uncharacterized protein n=1 Tax=Paraconexibacter sp. AEG42_29 TaxID=2997339 RepID=A0AAU7B0G8_9ACTN